MRSSRQPPTSARRVIAFAPLRRRLLAVAVAVATMLPLASSAYDKTFSAGSLIIPAQIEYQTDSGIVASYGLIYTLLMKNEARVAAKKKPITIYWVIQPAKQSHHRCRADNNTLPSYSTFNDNDGCDLAIQSASGQPVALVNPDGTELAPFTASAVAYWPSNGNVGRCTTGSGTCATSTGSFNVDSNKTVMKYSGGLFVIDAPDRNDTLALLASDTDLAQYHKNGATVSGIANPFYVAIHSARAMFTAPVARAINIKPPVIALIGTGQVNILQDYLQLAGLTNIANYAGTVTSHGVIYDVVNPLTDFVSTDTWPKGAINMPADPNDASKGNFYQVLWAPHWAIDAQSTIPKDCDPGDDTCGDGIWTHNGDDAKTNSYKNINLLADNGNGIFAECVSIESLEGVNTSSTSPCPVTKVCQNSAGTQYPYSCDPGYTAVCNGCFQCSDPMAPNLDTVNCGEVQCTGGCPTGSTSACNACWTCPAGYTLSSSDCNHVNCQVSTACSSGQYVCNGCWSCPTGYTLNSTICSNIVCASCPNGTFYSISLNQCENCPNDDHAWDDTNHLCVKNNGQTDSPTSSTAPTTVPKQAGATLIASATSVANVTMAATSEAPICPSNYQLLCPGQAPSVSGGSSYTRFHTTEGIIDNGLGNSFSGPDCTDMQLSSSSFFHSTATGDCLDYHPDTGGPGQIFSQKGNFNYSGTTGNVLEYEPPVVTSAYWPGVSQMITSRNASNPSRAGWDFGTFRHKDGDPAKGMVIYLAGHEYKTSNQFWGLRIVLNTLLNLGFSPGGTELARSEPVGYNDPTIGTQRVYQGTYVQLPPPGPFQDWSNYTTSSPQSWRFPYTVGHLYEYNLSSIGTTAIAFGAQTSNWDAAQKMPLPGSRSIFTFLGGSADRGWQRVDWTYAQTRNGCLDQDGNGKCDLSEALAACATAGVTLSTLQLSNVSGTQQDALGMFVQQVRGYCSAHDPTSLAAIMTPDDSHCDDIKQQKNRAKLGGLDHGSPAIVGPSRYVTDSPWNNRPVVAYVGGRDGMLHAIYVSGDTSWTAEGQSLPSNVQSGQELWAFIPPGQICGLATNNAMVDASVNVIDVLGNFPHDVNNDGVIDWSASSTEKPTGVREWRTVLLAAAGQGGSELFAMDVTNPLKPVLLWHVGGATEHDGKFDVNANGVFDTSEAFSKTDPTTYAVKWFDWDDNVASTSWIPTDYNTTSSTVLDAIKFGRWDYRNLGLTYGTAIGKVWMGDAYRYVAYVATNAADCTNTTSPLGYSGVEVFAIDLITGQKIWQWERMYTRKNSGGTVIADNTIPGRVALGDVNEDGSVERIYVGDLEGHLWELSATDGRNLNYLPDTTSTTDAPSYHSFPLFGTADMLGTGATSQTKALYTVAGSTALAQQPLTSPIGLGRFTDVKSGLETYLKGRLALVQGTMGVDWAIAPFELGHVFVLPVFPDDATTRLQPPIDLNATRNPLLRGVLVAAAAWDIPLQQGERVFGMPRIVNNEVIFNTASGSFTGDVADTTMDAGNLMIVGKDADHSATIANANKSFGGVLIFDNKVIVTTMSTIKQLGTVPVSLQGGVPTRPFNRYTPAIFRTWEPQAPSNSPYLR